MFEKMRQRYNEFVCGLVGHISVEILVGGPEEPDSALMCTRCGDIEY
jgi:hypothetical protein